MYAIQVGALAMTCRIRIVSLSNPSVADDVTGMCACVILQSGVAEILAKAKDMYDEGLVIADIGDGSYFGEVGRSR
jgi:hypothetical protein